MLVKKGPFPRKKYPRRKELVWTNKAKALTLMAWGLHGFIILLTGSIVLRLKPGPDNFFTAIIFAGLIMLPFYFVLYSLALLMIKPLDRVAKEKLAAQAKAKIKKLSEPSPLTPLPEGEGNKKVGLIVIGVAGSYGKTTMKEVLKQILDIRYKVLATPESVNTPVGISRWILKYADESTQIIIVEMGEHYGGDIKEICEITKPDIAVVTGINESHLERMKKIGTVVATVFEIVSNSKQGATVVLNADDQRVMENYKGFVWPDHRVHEFRIKNLELRIFDAEKLVWKAKSPELGEIEINLLGEYALGDVDAAILIGRKLGMSGEEIKKGIAGIKPVEHRLQPMPSAAGVLVIDDSYNGNPEGVKEAIKVLSRFTNRRKVYITPGLVEMGKSSAEIHREIGRQLAGVADVVILIKNSVTPWIEEGIKTTPSAFGGHPSLAGGEAPRSSPPFQGGVPPLGGEVVGVNKCQIIWFNSAPEAHESLKEILKPGDVVMFQNDWGDQYV